MTPKKALPERFDVQFKAVGRIRRPHRARTWAEYNRRLAVLHKLYENSQLEILRAFKDGELEIEQLVEADRQDKTRISLDSLKLRAPLWDVVEQTLAKMPGGKRRGSSAWRYRTSWDALKKRLPEVLPDDIPLSALATVDWHAVKADWPNGGSDWMHLRRAISRTLSRYLGDTYHPFRREVMKLIPTAREKKRKPQLTPERFAAIVAHTPEHVQASLWCLVLTGMRLGEYLRCTADDLDMAGCRVHVPGTKTEDADGWIAVEAHLWGWIVSGVPSRIGEHALRVHWKRAAVVAGGARLKIVGEGKRGGTRKYHLWTHPELQIANGVHWTDEQRALYASLPLVKYAGPTLHDLRHCHGQWAMDAGADERDVQDALRHSSQAMTRRYTLKGSTARVAAAIGKVFPAVATVEPKRTRGTA